MEQVDSDMLRYLDEDFYIEINGDFYHQCLSWVYANKEEFSTEQAATDSVRRVTSRGRTLTLPHIDQKCANKRNINGVFVFLSFFLALKENRFLYLSNLISLYRINSSFQ